jgi:hypothetical protein
LISSDLKALNQVHHLDVQKTQNHLDDPSIKSSDLKKRYFEDFSVQIRHNQSTFDLESNSNYSHIINPKMLLKPQARNIRSKQPKAIHKKFSHKLIN